MTVIKIPNAGDTYTGHVTGCEVVPGSVGQQVKFTFASGDDLYIGKDTADRQLLRAGFDGGGTPPTVNYAGVAGNTLHFSRTPNKNPALKPYWNVEIATGTAPAPSKRVAPPTQVPGDTPERYKAKPAPQSDPFDPGPPEPQDYPVRAAAGQPSGSTGRTREHIAAAYAWALTTAYEAQTGLSLAKGGTEHALCTPDSVQAGAATLLIQLEKTGLLFQAFDKEAVKEALDLEEIFG